MKTAVEFSVEKFHLQLMLTDIGCSSFKRLVVFCVKMDQEDQVLCRKMLIEPRKHYLRAHRTQLEELLCSCVCDRLIIITFTSMPTKCRLCKQDDNSLHFHLHRTHYIPKDGNSAEQIVMCSAGVCKET